MSWTQLTIDVPDDLADAVTGELCEARAAGIWESDAPPGCSRLIAYFSIKSNLDQVEEHIRTIFERRRLPSPHMARSIVEDCDWTGEWKKSYRAFEIGGD